MLCSASIFRGGSVTPQVARDLRERGPARPAIQTSEVPRMGIHTSDTHGVGTTNLELRGQVGRGEGPVA